jgi:hypothetical protein
LKASIEETRTELETQDQSRWMVLPHNELNDYLNEQVEKAQGRIASYKHAYGSNPANNPLVWILGIGLPITLISLIVIDSRFNGHYRRADNRHFFAKPDPKEETRERARSNGQSLPKGF